MWDLVLYMSRILSEFRVLDLSISNHTQEALQQSTMTCDNINTWSSLAKCLTTLQDQLGDHHAKRLRVDPAIEPRLRDDIGPDLASRSKMGADVFLSAKLAELRDFIRQQYWQAMDQMYSLEGHGGISDRLSQQHRAAGCERVYESGVQRLLKAADFNDASSEVSSLALEIWNCSPNQTPTT